MERVSLASLTETKKSSSTVFVFVYLFAVSQEDFFAIMTGDT